MEVYNDMRFYVRAYVSAGIVTHIHASTAPIRSSGLSVDVDAVFDCVVFGLYQDAASLLPSAILIGGVLDIKGCIIEVQGSAGNVW